MLHSRAYARPARTTRRPDRAPRRADRAARRSANGAEAYADAALAGAADALFHAQAEVDWAKAGAPSIARNATAAISVFMVRLHLTNVSGIAHLPSSSSRGEKLLRSLNSRPRVRLSSAIGPILIADEAIGRSGVRDADAGCAGRRRPGLRPVVEGDHAALAADRSPPALLCES